MAVETSAESVIERHIAVGRTRLARFALRGGRWRIDVVGNVMRRLPFHQLSDASDTFGAAIWLDVPIVDQCFNVRTSEDGV